MKNKKKTLHVRHYDEVRERTRIAQQEDLTEIYDIMELANIRPDNPP